jgi:hypothetical protein
MKKWGLRITGMLGIPALWRLRQEAFKFKAHVGFRVSSR